MINKILKDLGFSEKEIEVYLAVLQEGKTTPAKVAKLTGINRSTIYSICKDLVTKQVISEDLAGKQSYIVALPPEELKNLAKIEELNLENKKILIEQAIDGLKDVTKNTKYSIPKITFIYEEDLENFLYRQSPEWNASIMSRDGVWWGFQDTNFLKSYSAWIDWFWKECTDKNLTLKILTNESSLENDMKKKNYDKRLVKFWGKEGDFTATTWVNGDYLIMIKTDVKPFYLVQIYDQTLAHNMRQIFKSIFEEN